MDTTGMGATRRTILRGAVTAGALAWAAPVVQVIAPPAHAAGTLKPELSYVALLLRRGTTFYRVKYGFNSQTATPVIEVVAGPTWTAGRCSQEQALPFYKNGAGLPSGGTLSSALPPLDVVSHYDVYNRDGGFFAVFPVGVVMVDWLVHKGGCCAAQSNASGYDDNTPCQPARPNGVYKVQFLQYVNNGARSGNQWLFPAGPNNVGCTKLGTKTYTQACQATGSPMLPPTTGTTTGTKK